MTFTPAHKPAGIPEGGQFTATTHAEPAVALADRKPAPQEFQALATEEFAEAIDAKLNGRIKGKDWYSGGTVNQEFESELDESTIHVYTRNPSRDEGVTYTVSEVDGVPRVTLHDDYNPDFKPRDLHPETWSSPEDALKEISETILEMEGGATDAAAERGQSPDGFSSDAEYRRWRER